MPKFQVQIGRTTTVYHSTLIEAESFEKLQEELHTNRSDHVIGLSDEWEQEGIDEPERLETINISDEDDKPLAHWSDGDGWDDEVA